MILPKVITELVKAQENFDSAAYADCFSDNAVVLDENHTHAGKKEIEKWIAAANKKYNAVMRPIGYEQQGDDAVLSAEISGSFPGSPLVLKYNMKITDGLINSLQITG